MQSERVPVAVAEALNIDVDQVGPDTTADMLEEWDSMGTLSILLMLKQEFNLTLQPRETENLQSVASILDLLREKDTAS